jgi:hypothetical protein
MEESTEPTPYAVRCSWCADGGLVYLTHACYMRQMMRPDAMWRCPRCGEDARWDDNNYENRLQDQVNEKTGEPLGDSEWED